MSNFWNFLIGRLKEPSTWRGIIAVVTAFGIALNPEQVAAIVTAGVSLIGMIEVFRKETPPPVE